LGLPLGPAMGPPANRADHAQFTGRARPAACRRNANPAGSSETGLLAEAACGYGIGQAGSAGSGGPLEADYRCRSPTYLRAARTQPPRARDRGRGRVGPAMAPRISVACDAGRRRCPCVDTGRTGPGARCRAARGVQAQGTTAGPSPAWVPRGLRQGGSWPGVGAVADRRAPKGRRRSEARTCQAYRRAT